MFTTNAQFNDDSYKFTEMRYHKTKGISQITTWYRCIYGWFS